MFGENSEHDTHFDEQIQKIYSVMVESCDRLYSDIGKKRNVKKLERLSQIQQN